MLNGLYHCHSTGFKGDCIITMKDSDFMDLVLGKIGAQKVPVYTCTCVHVQCTYKHLYVYTYMYNYTYIHTYIYTCT